MSAPPITEDDIVADVPGARAERLKRRAGLVLGPVIATSAYALSDGPSPELVFLMLLAVVWWLTEALPMAAVALMVAVGAVLLGLATPKIAFGTFGTPLLYLFVGSFFIAEAMRVRGLGERVGRAMAARARGRMSMLVLIGMTAFTLSMIMSNAAATAILLPIALAVAPRPGAKDPFGAALVLAVAWGASVGGIGTPVGTPPNLIGIAELEQRGRDVGFFGWMAVGIPMGLLMMLGLFAVLAWRFGVRPGQALERTSERVTTPWAPGEVSVVIALAIALVGWLVPTALGLAAPDSAAAQWADSHMTEEVVALIAGCSLFVLPGQMPGGQYRPALVWAEATRIEWGVILLFGAGILLGELSRTTGLAADWGRTFVGWTGASSTWEITALVTGIAIVLSEATSNTATATLMAPLAGGLAEAAGAAPVPAVLGATIGASFGFMMPISTAPNALAYATGRISVLEMVKAGILFDVLGYLLILAGLRVLCPLLGWT